MAQPVAQNKSFNSGEWAPQLYSRVDMERYHAGAALIRNMFVDYRGGVSTRTGTKFVIPTLNSASDVRLIAFQASFDAGYAVEFGNAYLRFMYQGAPVLETGLNITGVTQANPGVITVANTYSVGQMVYISGVGGMTQLNNRYFYVRTAAAGNITLNDMFGNPVDTSAYGAYTAGGTVERVYSISSPYSAADLPLLKFVQSNNSMIICHPAHSPHILTLQTATSWVLAPIVFGASVSIPTGVVVGTTLGAGTVHYSYIVTAVDANGQESGPSAPGALGPVLDLRTTVGSNTVAWAAVTGATAYNVYKSEVSVGSAVPIGSSYGFIGQVTGTSLADSNIAPDFSIQPPVQQSPFANGAPVDYVAVNTVGQYSAQPTLTFSASPNGRTAIGQPYSRVLQAASIANGGLGYTVGAEPQFPNGIILRVTSIGGGGAVTAVQVLSFGNVVNTVLTNPLSVSVNPPGASGLQVNFDWYLDSILLADAGSGYTSVPTVTFGGAGIIVPPAATAVLDTVSGGNPAVPQFYQQRLVLGVLPQEPQTLYFSQPGNFYNFDTHFPVQSDDAITATLVSGQVNNIKAMIPQTAGLIVMSDGLLWLVNGGQPGAPISPSAIAANPQAFVGCNDMPPIVANFDILYAQSKGTGVRNSSYNFSYNVFTSTDISVWSSHLFHGYELLEWAWAEEPFKVVWAVRNDGELLSLTFQKEQEFIAWAHSDTQGEFKSICTVVEPSQVGAGYFNAIYTVVERTVHGQPWKYIEYFQERQFPNGIVDAWTVDSGLQYDGAPATTFTGGEHLGGLTVTGLADGEVIPPFVMAGNGAFTLPTPASKVTVGLGFTCQLKTLPLDLGEPTVQGKVKTIVSVLVKVAEALGIKAGSSFDNLKPMKDLIRGNVSSTLTGQGSDQRITDLVTGDAMIILDSTYTVPGQYCFQIDEPYPATITGVFPNVALGNTTK